jgi:leader peptidase (prepilin peptidase)/N-methyltransferase
VGVLATYLVPLVAGLGLIVGSFLNVVAHRLPIMMERQWRADAAALESREAPEEPAFNLLTPRSRCPHCDRPVRARHNIPVVSYIWLRGRCADCNAPISAQYPLVELTTGLLSGWVAAQFGLGAPLLAALVFLWYLIAMSLIDAQTTLLPDILTLPLLWLGLLLNVHGIFAPLSDAVIGAAAGYLVLWSIYWLFKLTTGREGMGYGDFKLLAALGAWFGWTMLLPIVLVSSVTGAVVGIGLILLRRRGKDIPMPFGPYLAIAGLVCLLQGRALLHALALA